MYSEFPAITKTTPANHVPGLRTQQTMFWTLVEVLTECCGCNIRNITNTSLYQHLYQRRRLAHVKFHPSKRSQYGKRASQS